jgi:hypothetical protein
MKLTDEIEEEKKKEDIINAWKKSNGIKDEDASKDFALSKLSIV